MKRYLPPSLSSTSFSSSLFYPFLILFFFFFLSLIPHPLLNSPFLSFLSPCPFIQNPLPCAYAVDQGLTNSHAKRVICYQNFLTACRPSDFPRSFRASTTQVRTTPAALSRPQCFTPAVPVQPAHPLPHGSPGGGAAITGAPPLSTAGPGRVRGVRGGGAGAARSGTGRAGRRRPAGQPRRRSRLLRFFVLLLLVVAAAGADAARDAAGRRRGGGGRGGGGGAAAVRRPAAAALR